MINTFQEYMTNEKSLSIGQMEQIHQMMAQEIADDEDALELYEDLLTDAIKYAGIRAEWAQMTREEKMDRDPYRTAIHDSVIMDINVLKDICARMEKRQSGVLCSGMKIPTVYIENLSEISPATLPLSMPSV